MTTPNSEYSENQKNTTVKNRPVIYQLLPRLFSNTKADCMPNGTIEQNGCGKLNDLTPKVLREIGDLGVTHVWLTGVIEHAQATDYSAYGIAPDNHHVVKGLAGSPYAIKDYYDIDPDLAVDVNNRMAEFEAAVDRIHAAGMKVVIDFVPNHVARQYHSDACPADAPGDLGADDDTTVAFARDNNFYYIPGCEFAPEVDLGSGNDRYTEFPAKATGNDCFSPHPSRNDWYETVKLNYGVDYATGARCFNPIPSTWRKMLHILLYWASKGVDAFRCDMAFMVPIEFWEWAVPQVKEARPGVEFIAEIYDVNQYYDFIHRGRFDYLYDKVNLYDKLRAIQTWNHSAADLTHCWQCLGDMAPHMLNFLENHDEQRFASPQYAGDAALVTPSLVVAATFGTGAMMIYAGQELGEAATDAEGFSGLDGRTTIFDYWSIPTLRRWLASGEPDGRRLSVAQRRLRKLYATVLRLCNSEESIREGRFYDLMYVNLSNPRFNPHRHFAYLRQGHESTTLIAVNFDPSAAAEVAVNIPAHAFEWLGIKPGEREAIDLLTGESIPLTVSPDAPASFTIPACGAVMLKFSRE